MRPLLWSSIRSSLCLLALVGCAAPKPAATVASATPSPETDAQRLINYSIETGEPINTADGKKLICKQETVTNTRLKNKKICLTQDQWMERTNNARNGLDEARRAGEYVQCSPEQLGCK